MDPSYLVLPAHQLASHIELARLSQPKRLKVQIHLKPDYGECSLSIHLCQSVASPLRSILRRSARRRITVVAAFRVQAVQKHDSDEARHEKRYCAVNAFLMSFCASSTSKFARSLMSLCTTSLCIVLNLFYTFRQGLLSLK